MACYCHMRLEWILETHRLGVEGSKEVRKVEGLRVPERGNSKKGRENVTGNQGFQNTRASVKGPLPPDCASRHGE